MENEKSLKGLSELLDFFAVVAEKLSGMAAIPPLPNIEDYMPEAVQKRQLKVLKRSVQRKRKLSAEDMLDIYLLHKAKRVSFRSIAKQFEVSEWTIRKTFQKVEKALTEANLEYREYFPSIW